MTARTCYQPPHTKCMTAVSITKQGNTASLQRTFKVSRCWVVSLVLCTRRTADGVTLMNRSRLPGERVYPDTSGTFAQVYHQQSFSDTAHIWTFIYVISAQSQRLSRVSGGNKRRKRQKNSRLAALVNTIAPPDPDAAEALIWSPGDDKEIQ